MANIEYFETVVVGSGFGGSVATHRLAEAYHDVGDGDRVCLLERGKSYAPGEFARAPWEFGRNFWQPKKGQRGLFDVWSFKGCEAVVSAGLGGGSLIYSNAMVRPPAEWLADWPVEYADLAQHYAGVEQMLDGQSFPAGEKAYAGVAKAPAMQEAAGLVGKSADFDFVKLAVSFHDRPGPAGILGVGIPLQPKPYGNLHTTGHARTTCTLCCQCNIGCNQGSKNTLDHTYLSAAQYLGAEIRPHSEVKVIRPIAKDGRDGYEVDYLDYGDADSNTDGSDAAAQPERRTLRCRRLILSAGTFGTTYLLLKNSRNFPQLSPALGQRFSTNGDYLMWLSGAKQPAAPGQTTRKPMHFYPSVGLPVTMAIKYDDFYLEDAGYPVILDWILAAKDGLLGRAIRFLLRYLWAWLTRDAAGRIGNQLALVIGNGGAEADSIPLGAMGLDEPDGVMAYKPRRWLLFSKRKRRLQVNWTMKSSKAYFTGVEREMTKISDALGARIARSTLSKLGRSIAVHPLGGCPMGSSPETGVCDPYGEVFGYDNLFVADGSVMPSPIGANPSLTIAAFSSRMADAIVDGKTRRPDPAHLAGTSSR